LTPPQTIEGKFIEEGKEEPFVSSLQSLEKVIKGWTDVKENFLF